MNNKKDISALIDIIDRRIRKILKEQNLCYRYVGKVTSIKDTGNPNAIVGIKLLGFASETDAEYNITNGSSSILKVGDTVYIDTINGKMNSGIITQICKSF